MFRLSVICRVHGGVIDHQVVDVAEELWLGDLQGAAVSFPGVVFRVDRTEVGVVIHGAERPITLLPGGNLRIDLSDRIEGFEIELTVVRRAHLARERWYLGDIRLLVLTCAIVLFGMWVETLDRWAHTNPDVAAELEALPRLWADTTPDLQPAVEEPTHRAPSVRYIDE